MAESPRIVAAPLRDRVAIVTGGGRGIGRAIAHALAAAGARVTVSARTVAEIEEVAREIRAGGADALAVPADVTRPADAEAIVARTLDRFGRLDVLVNNAGVPGPAGLLPEISEPAWEETLRVNLTGPFLCLRAALPTMIARRAGNVINVSSGAGLKRPRDTVRSLPYAVSKFGLEGLTDALAVQMRPYGINVNSLLPGPTRTRFHADRPGAGARTDLAGPEDTAPAAVYLAALRPGELTGQALDARTWLATRRIAT